MPQSSTKGHASDYVGRFAPSPTGPLHFGSLLAALASYLDARANGGRWLVRIEDLDPPREPPGAADRILRQLEALGLHWDDSVLYQSTRLDAYAEALERLDQAGLVYPCDCTRQQIRAMGSVYDNRCRHRAHAPERSFALRLRTTDARIAFEDLVQGEFGQQLQSDVGDFVIKRKDSLIAYQLAVVVDDAFQGITHIVRGHDLLDSTPRQLYLQKVLQFPQPRYAHIPVIVNAEGEKLSKQSHAPAIRADQGSRVIQECLRFLGHDLPRELRRAPLVEQLSWAAAHWDIQSVPKLANIAQPPV